MSLLLLPFRLLGRLTSWLGAHFAALASVVGLIALLRGYDAAPGAVQTFLHADGAQEQLLPFGLAYEGGSGFLLALSQAAAILMAFLLSLSRQTLRRRAGRLALLGWVGVCTLGAVALAAENALEFGGQASLCVLLLLATLNRTVAGWAPRERRTGARRFACCGRQGRVDGVDVVDVSEIPTDVAPACGTC